MTANEDAIDLDAWEEIALESERHYGHVGCMECDCGPGIVRALIAELRSARAAIGPDSERIRELEAEVQRQKAWITDVLTLRVCGARHPTLPEVGPCWAYAYTHPDPVDKHHGVDPTTGAPWSWPLEAETPALRAAGLPLGPDKVAVDREALAQVVAFIEDNLPLGLGYPDGFDNLRAAALSEPQPKPEGTS